MELLILGGTTFVGRHLVDAALARGHAVTLFNRGRSAPDAYPCVERRVGDRFGDLAALRGRRWTAAIDVAAYVPSIVRAAARLLAPTIEHYTVISTRSVYADHADSEEDGRVETITDDALRDAEAARRHGHGDGYGALKALCERAAADELPGRVLVIRPGLIVGPHDPSDRFTYWPVRVARGGDVLAPGRPDRVVRAIDARDLAAWCIASIEARTTGTFNAGGADGLTMATLLDACRRTTGGDARLAWASEAFLVARGVTPWTELPLWLLERDNVFLETGNARAIAAGLTFRPLADTIRDTLAWWRSRGDASLRVGLTPAREAELLAYFFAAPGSGQSTPSSDQ